MKNSLKKYFIPHVENGHKPHFLRGRMIVYLAGFILLFEVVFLFQSFYVISYTDFFAAILPNVLIDQTNENRQADNLGLLMPNSLLEEAANLKARDMAEKGYFAHVSPENQTPWHWFSEVGYVFNYAGENLAVNFVDSKDVTKAWMNSLGHRANILGKQYTEIGIGTARGIYKGREAVFVVQLFGSPSVGATPNVEEEIVSVREQSETEVIAVAQNTETPAPSSITVQGAEAAGLVSPNSNIPPSSSGITRLVSSPKTVIGYIYGMLSILILFALLLKVFIKIKIQHPRLIASATFLIISIGVITLFNQQVTVLAARIL